MNVLIFKKRKSKRLTPIFGERIHAGFESPASDYEEARIDLNDYVTSYPEATFYAKVMGNCMEGSYIFDGDLLVVNRSLIAENGDIVVGMVNGEFILRGYIMYLNDHYLVADHPGYSPIKQDPDNPFQIWGVVTHTIFNQKQKRNVRTHRLQQFLR